MPILLFNYLWYLLVSDEHLPSLKMETDFMYNSQAGIIDRCEDLATLRDIAKSALRLYYQQKDTVAELLKNK